MQGVLGCHMKSHYAVAEYVELQSGIQFNYGKKTIDFLLDFLVKSMGRLHVEPHSIER